MRIGLVGDIALIGGNTILYANWEKRYASIKKVLDNCDYVIGNLESPLTLAEKPIGGKSAYLKSDPINVDILNYLGLSHVTLANNHMYDYGEKGLEDTIITLDKKGIKWYGVKGKKETIINKDSSILLSGYCCYSTNGKGMGIVNELNPMEIEREIEEVNNQFSILSLHWGQEHIHYPNHDHIKLCNKLCKKGKGVIHGHHPHVIQGIDKIKDWLVFYSTGNFIFDDVYTGKSKDPLIKLSKDNRETIIIILDIKNNTLEGYEIEPFEFDNEVYHYEPSIHKEIEKWTNYLATNEEKYVKERQTLINNYLEMRKKRRNLEWYLKRMNAESLKMILSAKYDNGKYRELIKKYIE